MADIILINDQDQEQTLTGVSKLVARGASGDVEFSVGGGQTQSGAPIITNMQKLATTPSTNDFGLLRLTGSPMEIKLYFDVPKGTVINSISSKGGLPLMSTTGTGGSFSPITNETFSATDLNDTTTRYITTTTLTYNSGETYASVGYIYVFYSYIYEGISVSSQEGQFVLSGPNAAKFLNSTLFGYDATQSFNVYDMREDTVENLALKVFRSIDACKTVYFPAGIVSLAAYSFRDMPNLELLDFSLATAVPTLGPDCFGNSSADYQIKVPAALYDEWIAAANWSDFASHIVAV